MEIGRKRIKEGEGRRDKEGEIEERVEKYGSILGNLDQEVA